MPKINSILSIYPPYSIDQRLKEKSYKKINLYIDLKNCLTSLFVEDVVQEIISNSENMVNCDSSIFQSILYNCAWWKNYARKENLDIDFYIFTDIGKSSYHRNIYLEYKKRREISDINHPIHNEKIREIRERNFNLADTVINRIPHIHFFRLVALESDFLPYFLYTRKFKDQEDTFHIIATSDHDHYQCLISDNIVQIYKSKQERKTITKNNMLYKYTNFNKVISKNKPKKIEILKEVDFRWISAIQAVVGDSGDDIPGVHGIGPMRATELFSKKELVKRIIGTPDELDRRITQDGKFFLEDQVGLGSMPTNWRKAVLENDTVTQSYKLISFEQLSLWLEKKNTTSKIEWLDYIEKVLNKKEIDLITSSVPLLRSLSKLEDNQLTENVVKGLF